MTRHRNLSPSDAAARIRRCARAMADGVEREQLLKSGYSEREVEAAKKMLAVSRQ